MIELDHRQQLIKLRNHREKLEGLRRVIYEGTRSNKEYADNVARLAQVDKTLSTTKLVNNATKELLERVMAEDMAFKNRRLDFMSSVITDFLSELFPDDNFTAKVKCDFNRGMKAELLLLDRYGNERLIHMSEGRFAQSLISFGASIGVSENMGAKKLYLDEAFSVSDPENLQKVSDLYRALLDKGMQIIMIEQTSTGYKDLPRREIRLARDVLTNKVLKPVILDL